MLGTPYVTFHCEVVVHQAAPLENGFCCVSTLIVHYEQGCSHMLGG